MPGLTQLRSLLPQVRDGHVADALDDPPRVDQLDLPAGTVVTLRTDLDIPVEDGRVTDDTRITAALGTLRLCRQRGWRTIVMGHVGRKPELSTAAIAAAYGEALGIHVAMHEDWLEDGIPSRSLREAIPSLQDGDVLMLQNLRKYGLERSLWSPDATAEALPPVVDFCEAWATQVSGTYVNDAVAAGNFDVSTCVLPLFAQRVAIGLHMDEEINLYGREVAKVDAVIFSGSKANKLDDLEALAKARPLALLLAGGALAMALVAARRGLDAIGRAATDDKLPVFVSQNRVSQAQRVLEYCSTAGTSVLLPVDYRLDDGTTSDHIPPDRLQFDIGPRTEELFKAALADYGRTAGSNGRAFLNGVMGWFEKEQYAHGTEAIVRAFTALTKHGVGTFVGGGEGRRALVTYASEGDVTHAFTAGGTILKLMRGQNLPAVTALRLAANYHRALSEEVN